MLEIDLETIFVCFILMAIDFYSETQIKNDGSIIERLVYLINIKSLFNILKLLIVFCSLLIIFKYVPIDVNKRLLDNDILRIYFTGLLFASSVSVFMAFYNYRTISKQFGNYYMSNNLPKINYLISSVQFIIYRLLSFSLIFFIFIFLSRRLINLNISLQEKNLGIFDWLTISSENADNYNKGVYFSIVLTIILFFIFNNAFLKRQSSFFQFRVIKWGFLKYFFISIILSIGLFTGLFSIFNGIYNLLNTGFSEWINKENILGILPIRISSVLILYHLTTYIYKEVLNKSFISFLSIGILPIRNESDKISRSTFNLNNKETLFFCQISFYIINLALAELFIIYSYQSVYLSILNFSILFIVDDFSIIDDYTNRFGSLIKKHFRRLTLFNLVMVGSSFTILISQEYYWYLLTYTLIIIVLAYYYFKNLHHYRMLYH